METRIETSCSRYFQKKWWTSFWRTLNHQKPGNEIDKAWWMGETNGKFTIQSAFKILSSKRYSLNWGKMCMGSGDAIKDCLFLMENVEGENSNR